MHQSINLPTDPWSLADFADAADLRAFYTRYGCDGVEVILAGEGYEEKIESGMVNGLHLIFYPEWISLWQEDYAYLDAEFGSRAAWREFYGAAGAKDLAAIYRGEFETAERLGAKYVVFHVADNALPEYFTLRARRTDEEIIDTSCELLNHALAGKDYGFSLLLENLMFGGMDLTDPRKTERALAGVDYAKTGVMLDTGHLMSTNRKLRDEEAACEYIRSVVDAHGSLAKHFEGVHLHRSLSGAYMEETARQPVPLSRADGYLDRFGRTMQHMRRADPHKPFTAAGLPALVEHIAPQYLVHELSRAGRADWKDALARQTAALQKGVNHSHGNI